MEFTLFKAKAHCTVDHRYASKPPEYFHHQPVAHSLWERSQIMSNAWQLVLDNVANVCASLASK